MGEGDNAPMKGSTRLVIFAALCIPAALLLYFTFFDPTSSATHYEDFMWVIGFFLRISIALILLFSAAFILTYQPKGRHDAYYYDQKEEKEGEYSDPGWTDRDAVKAKTTFWFGIRRR